jgi:CRP/FNR family nitrogen fixation transcriptional regulator
MSNTDSVSPSKLARSAGPELTDRSWPGHEGFRHGGIDDLLVPLLPLRTGIRIAVAKDEEIYGQGDDTEFFYCILRGAVRTSHHMRDGRRHVGDFYREGDMFGFETRPHHRFSAEALQDCVVLALKHSALKSADREFERLIEASIEREFERAQDHLLLLACKSASEKMASFLLDSVRGVGGDSVDLPMSRQDIADYLALSIETVSRMLSQLRESRIVAFSSRRCFRVINPTALAQLAEAPFRSIQNRSQHGPVVAEWRSFGDSQRDGRERPKLSIVDEDEPGQSAPPLPRRSGIDPSHSVSWPSP